MPFKSEAQGRYFEANKAKLERQGVAGKEREQSSKGLKLFERAPKGKPENQKVRPRLVLLRFSSDFSFFDVSYRACLGSWVS
jgi:hypothetical protein